jgi:hypothetical protein
MVVFDNTLPSGWTNFIGLDRRFPLGASTYGGRNNTDGVPISNFHKLRLGLVGLLKSSGSTHHPLS